MTKRCIYFWIPKLRSTCIIKRYALKDISRKNLNIIKLRPVEKKKNHGSELSSQNTF